MPIDPTAVGASVGPVISSWDARDCMLYALSVGACMDDATGPELRFVTENSRGSRTSSRYLRWRRCSVAS